MPSEQTKKRFGVMKSGRRREELRRAIPKPGIDFKALFLRRELVNALLIFFVFFLAAGSLTLYSHEQDRLVVGQVMKDARLKRVDFMVINEEATETLRQRARERAPFVFELNRAYLDTLSEELINLPKAMEGVTSVGELADEIRVAYGFDEARLAAVQEHSIDGRTSDQWREWVEDIVGEVVPSVPQLTSQDFQRQQLREEVPEFRGVGPARRTGAYYDFKPEAQSENRRRWREALASLNMPGSIEEVFAARLATNPQPTYIFDQAATAARAEAEASRVPPSTVEHLAGEPIYRRGDVLTDAQRQVVEQERSEWRRAAPAVATWYRNIGVLGVVALITIFIAGYLIRFYPRVVRNPLRVIAMAVLGLGGLVLTVAAAVQAPMLLYGVAFPVMVFLGVVLVLAYDQRLAMMMVFLLSALTTLALEESTGFFVLLAASSSSAIAGLRWLRHRNALVRAAALSAFVTGAGALILGLLETPLFDQDLQPIVGAWKQIWWNAAIAFGGVMLMGFVLLGILPTVERIFDITTGLTLMELRDPRQPLLRQLQERAPGTYNHSLQVANVAEAAAEAVAADGMLAYVGALYHDIGKMNKPGYFVENQNGGPNKHEKLSPAMSLLVIVGHVKDGVELAREYNLPRSIIHFIESHHGTTLVEYFYHAAKNRAAADGEGERVTEIEFRYPGPRPRTKETAILMLADAAESATRALSDPAPASIEHLVRKLSRQRLKDGQFDECDLTLRELATIEDAIIRSIWALHHGRIPYKGAEDRREQSRAISTSAGLQRAEARSA
jgi:putative nucleotidyltransferase with HDIG domain